MGVLSREFLRKLRLVEQGIAIVDMEAGLEHFGRGIDEAIDKVVLVVEPSFESINIAERIRGLAAGMNKEVAAVLNKMPSEKVTKRLLEELSNRALKLIGIIPNDLQVFEAGLEGRIPEWGEAAQAAGQILDGLLSRRQP